MITFRFSSFTFVVCVSHTVNVLATDIILNIRSLKHLIFTYDCISVRDYSNN